MDLRIGMIFKEHISQALGPIHDDPVLIVDLTNT